MAEATTTTPEDRPSAVIYDLAGERLARRAQPFTGLPEPLEDRDFEGSLIGREVLKAAWLNFRRDHVRASAVRHLGDGSPEFLMVIALYQAMRKARPKDGPSVVVGEAERMLAELHAAMPESAAAKKAMAAIAFMNIGGMPS